ncbi:MAG: uroporphyrinogen-III decarboxylase [Deltaproteobacteria bacterium]|nr:uroporphyrinogen-III decarboxylase [Deltaproteobacteria bacterium]
MISRERVQMALNHQEADRVPIDIGGLAMTSMHLETYKKVLDYFGIQEEIKLVDQFQRSVKISKEVIDKLHGDTWSVGPKWKPWKEVSKDHYIDEWGIKYYDAPDSLYWHMVEHPLSNATLETLEEYQWPDPYDPFRIEGLEEEAKRIYEDTDYAIVFGGFGFKGDLFDMPCRLRSHTNFYMDLLLNEDFINALLKKFVKYWSALAEATLKPIGKYITAVSFNDDMGSQSGPLMSPEVYRKLIKPRQQEVYAKIKECAPQAKLVLHSCGSVYKFIPDFLEIGIDALNPIQLTAKNMSDTGRLKREFGEKLTFWGGGCDTHEILPHGTVADIREEVKRRMKDLAPGGGFVFTPVHNIQPDVNPEKICALFDAAYEFGNYPIK